MKRLGLVFTVIVVVIGIATPKAHAGCWHYYDGGWHWVDYGRDYSGRGGNGYVDRGGGWYGGRVDYDGYGCYARGDVHSSYPSGSLLSGLIGVPTYNDEQYWAYQNRILDLGEKGLDRQSGEQSYVKDQKLLSEANQRGKLQKLEEENAELKNQLTEMRKEVLDLRQMLQEFMKQNQSKK